VCSPPPEAGETRRSGLLALLCGIGSLVAFFSEHFGGFLPLAYAAVLFGLAGFVFGLAGVLVSRGERRSGAIGLVAAVVGIALPVLFLIALIVAFSQAE
jgi:hypothetical protein